MRNALFPVVALSAVLLLAMQPAHWNRSFKNFSSKHWRKWSRKYGEETMSTVQNVKTINSRKLFPILALAVALVIGSTASSSAAKAPKNPFSQIIKVTHGKVDATNSQRIDLGNPGPSMGDVLAFYIPLTSSPSGYLTGTLTVTGSNQPAEGMEVRIAALTVSIGSQSDQLVIGGSALYNITSPTLSIGQKTIRPVVGGSGKYAGARGWVESVQHTDGSWTHTFHITK
ncbi:MAG: hypothetical protein WCQ52_00925 [Actinomycetes bacterium]